MSSRAAEVLVSLELFLSCLFNQALVCGLHDALGTADFATNAFDWIKLGSTAEISLRMKEFALEAIRAVATVRTALHVLLVGEWLKSQEVVKVWSALAFLKKG
jgi:hypothetical protein